MSGDETNDAITLALSALVWTLQDPLRADRLLGVTGLDADGIRAQVNDPALLGAVLAFLEAHEPDLVACAQALDVPPVALVGARHKLGA